jgi:hypothetical protein
MSKRTSMIFLVIAATGFGLLIWYFARNTYWDELVIPSAMQGEARTNPFYAAERFVETLGGTSERRQVLGTPPTPNAVVILNNWHWSLIAHRRQQLEEWVRAGGRLVIDHTISGGQDDLESFSGLKFSYPERDTNDDEESEDEDESEIESDSESKSSDENIKNDRDETYFESGICGTLLASYSKKSSDLRDRYTVCELEPVTFITSSRPVFWALHDKDGMQAARMEVGKGSITLLNATPFGNRDFTQVDHGLLFVAVTQLKHGDLVVFLSEAEHPGLLSLIWGNAKPVVLLSFLFIAFVLWRGAMRFGPLTAQPELARRSLAEQIRGSGLFMLRFGGSQTMHAAMLRALEAAAERRIVNYRRLSSADRAAALAKAANIDAEKIQEAIHYSGHRNSHELQQALALLESVRRALLANSSNTKPS